MDSALQKIKTNVENHCIFCTAIRSLIIRSQSTTEIPGASYKEAVSSLLFRGRRMLQSKSYILRNSCRPILMHKKGLNAWKLRYLVLRKYDRRAKRYKRLPSVRFKNSLNLSTSCNNIVISEVATRLLLATCQQVAKPQYRE